MRRKRLPPSPFPRYPDPMPDSILPPILVELADRVIIANRRAGRTIAVAESCTGGLVSAALTEIAGSSDVFEAGFVTYSNDMKAELLKVSHDVLETFGAVSIATAWAMAQGALLNSHAHVAVAITGIAGAKTTVPTGFCSVPPPGPAIPVIATATWAWLLSKAPC